MFHYISEATAPLGDLHLAVPQLINSVIVLTIKTEKNFFFKKTVSQEYPSTMTVQRYSQGSIPPLKQLIHFTLSLYYILYMTMTLVVL